jgi:hypothetical protein
MEEYAESGSDHKYRVRRNQNVPVPSDPFRRYSSLRKYDKIISEFRVSFFVHQAAREEREGRGRGLGAVH